MIMVNNTMDNHSDTWYKRTWRPVCAFVYLTICIFDFIIMPIVTSAYANDISTTEMYRDIHNLASVQAQVAAIQIMPELRNKEWEPATLGAGGMMHLAFGALLTGSAITRGMEKRDK